MTSTHPRVWTPLRAALLAGACALLVASACSTPSARPTGASLDEDQDDASSLLDDPVKVDQARLDKARQANQPVTLIPKAAAKPSMPIDGKLEGWDASTFKVFSGKEHVELGEAFWSGPQDLSLRVGVKSDGAFLYFWIEVKDDLVLDQDDERGQPIDALVLWLRDPKLEAMFRQLPEGVSVDRDITTDVALAISPSGRVRLLEPRGQLVDGAVWASSFKTKDGYGAEIAVRAEVFPFVSSFPLPEVAFRVEAFDGDDAARPGVQSRLSMLPRRGQESPRFAVVPASSMLPAWDADGVAGRADGLGLWRRQPDKKWSYTSYEVLPRHWSYLDDRSSLAQELLKQDTMREVCAKARFDVELLEAYRSMSDKHRVGLWRCAARKVQGKCPAQAETRLFWVHMTREGDRWALKSQIQVFAEPMPQCADSPVPGELFRHQFAAFPLDFAGPSIWAVGWREEQRGEGYYSEARRAVILNVARPSQHQVGEVAPMSLVAEGSTRTVSDVKVYFTELDDEPGMDICELERVEEQSCRGLNAQCQARRHGTSVLTHVKTWSPKKGAFEPYLLSKHPSCTHDFSLNNRRGYMLMHLGDRLGLLPSERE